MLVQHGADVEARFKPGSLSLLHVAAAFDRGRTVQVDIKLTPR